MPSYTKSFKAEGGLQQFQKTHRKKNADLFTDTAILFRVGLRQILSSSRDRKFVSARRHLAIKLSERGYSTCDIAALLNRKDHTSICHYLGTTAKSKDVHYLKPKKEKQA